MKGQAKAKLNSLRIGPRKVRLLIDLIRNMKASEAVNQLKVSKKQAAKPVLKLLLSAIANAKENHNLLSDTLIVKTATVDDGPTLHRWMPRAMGRATPIRKRSAHISIVLEGELDDVKKIKKADKNSKINKDKNKDKDGVEKKKEDKKNETSKKDKK